MATKVSKSKNSAVLSEKAAELTRIVFGYDDLIKPGTVVKVTYLYDVPLFAFEGVNSSIQEKLAQMNPDRVFSAKDLIEQSQLKLAAPVAEELLLELFVQLKNIPLDCVGTNSHHAKLYKLK